MFHHILVPLDGSDRSDHIVWHLLPLLLPESDVLVTLAHVGPSARAEEHSAVLTRMLTRPGVRCEVRALEGEPHTELLRLVEELGVDLVAFTSRGAGGTREVSGSVASQLLRDAPAATLVCAPERCLGPRSTRLQRIQLVVRNQDEADRLEPLALDLAREHGARVVIQGCTDPRHASDCRDATRGATRRFSRAGVETMRSECFGPLIDSVAATATEAEADLVIVGGGDPRLTAGLLREVHRPLLLASARVVART